jgi:hypothetical protein
MEIPYKFKMLLTKFKDIAIIVNIGCHTSNSFFLNT